MAQSVSKREQEASRELYDNLSGRAGMVHCEGCGPHDPLVPAEGSYFREPGMCERHSYLTFNDGATE